MLEAMAAGCLVIGSKTSPVEEVLHDGHNGLLVDFFAPKQIADTICRVIDDPHRMRPLRERARASIVQRYDLTKVCLPAQAQLLSQLAGRRRVMAKVVAGQREAMA